MVSFLRFTFLTLLCLLVAGCGSDTKSSDTGAGKSPVKGDPTPTKSQDGGSEYEGDEINALLKSIAETEKNAGDTFPTEVAGLKSVLSRIQQQANSQIESHPKSAPVTFAASVGDIMSSAWAPCTDSLVIRFVAGQSGTSFHVLATTDKNMWSLIYNPELAGRGFDEDGFADADHECHGADPAKYGEATSVVELSGVLD